MLPPRCNAACCNMHMSSSNNFVYSGPTQQQPSSHQPNWVVSWSPADNTCTAAATTAAADGEDSKQHLYHPSKGTGNQQKAVPGHYFPRGGRAIRKSNVLQLSLLTKYNSHINMNRFYCFIYKPNSGIQYLVWTLSLFKYQYNTHALNPAGFNNRQLVQLVIVHRTTAMPLQTARCVACNSTRHDHKNAHFCAIQAKKDSKQNQRYAAAISWDGNDANLKAAVKTYTTRCKQLGLKPSANPQRDIRKYYQRLHTEHNVDPHNYKAGRHKVLPQQQAQQLVTSLEGWQEAGAAKPYGSLRVFKKMVPAAAAVIEEAGVSDAAVVKRIHEIKPSLQRKKLRVKKKLSDEAQADRLKTAKQRQRVPLKHQKAWVFIDAKHTRIEVDEAYGWIDTEKDLDIAAVQHAKSAKSNVPVLCYYIAVGYYVGAFEIHYYTGTTGMPANREGHTFKVSRSVQLALQLSHAVVPS